MDDRSFGPKSPICPNNPFIEFKKEEIEYSIPHRFEQQVNKYPKSLALKIKNLQLTYEELNKFSNRIAHSILAERDARQETVALLLEQGASLIATILAILKSGKIYVPIDPSNPKSRIQYTLEDAQTSLIVTDNKNFSLSNELAGDKCLVLNIDAIDFTSFSVNNLNLSLPPDSFAYIFYTSGSTGRPKGVVDNHRNVLHNIMRYTNTLHICSEDRLTLLQSCSFSGSISSLLGSLLNGAAAFLYSVREEGLGFHLANWLNEEGITIYHSVPMIFRSFLVGNLRFPKIRIIRLEGDVASKLDVRLYKKYFESKCILVNGLGATETGITRQYFIDKELKLSNNIVPIGYPVEDMGVQILDDEGKEVGINSVGEIAIKSNYLSPGYWRNRELTQTSFLSDPFGGNERIYKTGDMGRMRLDGCLEYIGRKDFQLKIRGHKVEAVEVEGALLNLSSIKEAVVMTREDRHGEAQLVAYLVPAGKFVPTVSAIREALAESLPDYMIPSMFVILDSLPLNSNSKIDRRALPDPDQMRLGPSNGYIAPRNNMEQRLVETWEEVFGIKPIGIRDNFFELGGNSLLAAKLFTQIFKKTGKDLPLPTILQAPTIEQLAGMFQESKSSRIESVLVPLKPRGSKPNLFCVHGHDGKVFNLVELARNLGNDQPFYGLQSVGILRNRIPLTKIELMAAKYVYELRTIQPEGPYFLAGNCLGAAIAFEMAQQLWSQSQKVAFLGLLSVSPSDFSNLVIKTIRKVHPGYHFIQRLKRKYIYLASLGRKERVDHLKELAKNITKRNIEKLEWNMAHRVFDSIGRPLPQFFWNVERANAYALGKYLPQKYPGRIHIFLSKETLEGYPNNIFFDWENMASGGVLIHEFPKDVPMREPEVKTLAEKLNNCLHELQTKATENLK